MSRWFVAAALLVVVAGSVVAQVRPPAGVRVQRNLPYGPDKAQRLDLAVPAGPGPFPLVIWIHGGGWEAGNRDSNPFVGLVARGYAVAAIDYRLSGQARFPAQIEDARRAVRFLRAGAGKFGLDPDRFGAVGTSAGGHLAALLGTAGEVKELDGPGANKEVSCRVQAVVDVCGPADLARLSPPGAAPNPVTRLLGGSTGEKRQLAELASPLTHASRESPPFLIVHGDRDTLVPLAQSQALHDALKKAGADVTLMVVPGAGHSNGLITPDNLRKFEAFFDRHLKKGE